MQWTAVVNPAAGRRSGRGRLEALLDALRERDVATHVSESATEGAELAVAALDAGRGLVACGGDGTVAGLAAVTAAREGTLAIVPSGSGNDFARHLGIDPRRPLDALRLLDEGTTTVVDLGRARTPGVPERVFTTVAGAGLDADANRWANRVRWASGTSLYVLALGRTLLRTRPRRYRVRVTSPDRDDEVWEGRAWLVAVGNASTYGGGMRITPDAQLDDGLLDVCIVGATSRLEVALRFPRVLRGTHGEVAAVRMLRGSRVELDLLDPPAEQAGSTSPGELWASGERVGPLPARMESWPGALRVVVPSSGY